MIISGCRQPRDETLSGFLEQGDDQSPTLSMSVWREIVSKQEAVSRRDFLEDAAIELVEAEVEMSVTDIDGTMGAVVRPAARDHSSRATRSGLDVRQPSTPGKGRPAPSPGDPCIAPTPA